MRNAVIRSVDIAIFGKVKYREWVWTMSDKLKELLIGKWRFGVKGNGNCVGQLLLSLEICHMAWRGS